MKDVNMRDPDNYGHLGMSRRPGQRIIISHPNHSIVTIEFLFFQRNCARFLISAPKDIKIDREEIFYSKMNDGQDADGNRIK